MKHTKEQPLCALVTGASSGIGQATAQALAQKGYRLVICGRNEAALNSLSSELSAITQVHALVFDVSDKSEVQKAIHSLPEAWASIDILINNAGNAHGLDPIQGGNSEDWDAMIDSNIKGVLYVTQAVLPQMIQRGQGHILMIGSTAAKEVYPKGNVYCATKAAVDALAQGIRMDLNGTGIKVGAIHPGMVHTSFSAVRFKGDQARAEAVYKGVDPLQAQDIAELICFVVSRPAHVNIADLVVMPTDQASSTIVARKS